MSNFNTIHNLINSRQLKERSMAKHKFQTEVSRLLHLIIHSLYSHPEIFLRELISNASDALDRLKYLTLTDDGFKGFAFMPKIEIRFDGENHEFLSVSDTGIGMDAGELEKNLGTIASSGTRHFLDTLSGDAQRDSNLIGQFGVGFYSAFMAASRVEVVSRKAGEEQAHRWRSDGQGEYEIEPAERKTNGTTVTLFLNEQGKEFASRWRIEQIVRKYSDHIAFPINLYFSEPVTDAEGKPEKGKSIEKVEQINRAAALWKRSKSEISDEEYAEFYKSLSHDSEDPFHIIHTQAEGNLEYTTLFFIPRKAPFDLFFVNYQPGVKLYVKRVFITDDEKELLPSYLRFVRGIIDSEDLPLNISREILQQNQILSNIRSAAVKKILGELKKIARNTPERYKEFYAEFGIPIKEGLYQDPANRENLLELVRFKSSSEEGLTGLAGYKERMKTDQKAIYYLSGGKEAQLRSSPLLEAYRKQDLEVLIMDDEIDEIVIPTLGRYQDLEFRAINRSKAAEDLKTDEDKQEEDKIAPLAKKIKQVLGEAVKDVRASNRLGEAPSVLVADEDDPSLQMQHIFKAMGQMDAPAVKPILEINPRHTIVSKLAGVDDEELFEDISRLLLEQALLLEGGEIESPARFAQRLNRIISRVL
jgi:molecular chaperone HtpG